MSIYTPSIPRKPGDKSVPGRHQRLVAGS